MGCIGCIILKLSLLLLAFPGSPTLALKNRHPFNFSSVSVHKRSGVQEMNTKGKETVCDHSHVLYINSGSTVIGQKKERQSEAFTLHRNLQLHY